MKSFGFLCSLALLLPPVASAATITGSPVIDNPTATNPFNTVNQGKLQGANGTLPASVSAINADTTSILKKAGFSSASSFTNVIGATTTTGILGDMSAAGKMTPAMLTAAQAGNTTPLKNTAVGQDLKSSLLAAGYPTTVIKLRYNVGYTETVGSLTPTGSPIIINTPTVMGRLAPEPLNAGSIPTQINNFFTTWTVKNISTVLATTLRPTRMYPLGVAAGNGLKVEWPCGIDVSTGADTCCGLSASNAIFHVQKGPGIADDLDVAGTGDASILDQSGAPVTLASDADALARLVLCSSTSAMDVVVQGSARFTAQGIPNK